MVVMDGDLRDRPEEIPRLLAEYEQGYDVVYAQRTRRKESLALRAAYFTFYRVLNRLSELEVPVDSGDFALLSRRVVDELNLLPERNRYLRGLRTWVGFRQTGIPVERDRRRRRRTELHDAAGASGSPSTASSPSRSRRFAPRGYSEPSPPGLASIYALWAVFERLFLGTSPQGFTALIVAITFFAGIQLLFLGLIGEYLGRVYDEAKSRPALRDQRSRPGRRAGHGVRDVTVEAARSIRRHFGRTALGGGSRLASEASRRTGRALSATAMGSSANARPRWRSAAAGPAKTCGALHRREEMESHSRAPLQRLSTLVRVPLEVAVDDQAISVDALPTSRLFIPPCVR